MIRTYFRKTFDIPCPLFCQHLSRRTLSLSPYWIPVGGYYRTIRQPLSLFPEIHPIKGCDGHCCYKGITLVKRAANGNQQNRSKLSARNIPM